MREFDDILRDKLAALPQSGTPDWDELRERLDGEAFDALLSPALSDAPIERVGNVVPMVPGWDALNDKLNQASDADGDAFDQLIARRVRHAEAPIPAQPSWRQLSHRMDTLWTVRRRLARYRVLEIAVAAALVATFAPLLRDNPVFQVPQATVSQPSEQPAAPATATPSYVLSPEEIVSAVATADARAAVATPEAIQSATATLTEKQPGLVTRALSWLSDLRIDDAPTQRARLAALQPAEPDVKSNRRSAGPMSHSASEKTEVFLYDFALSAFDEPSQTGALPARQAGPVATGAAAPALSVAALPKPVTASLWRLGLAGGLRTWQVATPADGFLRQADQSLTTNAGTVSATLSRALAPRLEVSLGLGYVPLSYETDGPIVVQRDAFFDGEDFTHNAEQLQSVAYDIAEVPVDLRYALLRDEAPLQVWAKAGVAGNFALASDYRVRTDIVDDEFLENARTAPGSTLGTNGRASDVVFSEKRLSELTPFVAGVAEAGVRSANSFVSARLGIEAELALSDRIDLFGGVDYSRFVSLTDGLGPNGDQPNAVGLQVGARVSL